MKCNLKMHREHQHQSSSKGRRICELKTGTLFSQENKDPCRAKINEENLHDLLDTIKRNVFQLLEFQRRRGRKVTDSLFK